MKAASSSLTRRAKCPHTSNTCQGKGAFKSLVILCNYTILIFFVWNTDNIENWMNRRSKDVPSRLKRSVTAVKKSLEKVGEIG